MKLIITFLILVGIKAAANSSALLDTTVDYVDLNKYIGKWYEISSIPQSFQSQCIKNTTAEYSFAEEGLIKVINSCETESGDRDFAEGRARVVDSKTNAKLEVTFVNFFGWIFAFGGKYWIMDLEPNYQFALVGYPPKYGWILARTPQLEIQTLVQLEYRIKELGYDSCNFLITPQDGGIEHQAPLCEYLKGHQ